MLHSFTPHRVAAPLAEKARYKAVDRCDQAGRHYRVLLPSGSFVGMPFLLRQRENFAWLIGMPIMPAAGEEYLTAREFFDHQGNIASLGQGWIRPEVPVAISPCWNQSDLRRAREVATRIKDTVGHRIGYGGDQGFALMLTGDCLAVIDNVPGDTVTAPCGIGGNHVDFDDPVLNPVRYLATGCKVGIVHHAEIDECGKLRAQIVGLYCAWTQARATYETVIFPGPDELGVGSGDIYLPLLGHFFGEQLPNRFSVIGRRRFLDDHSSIVSTLTPGEDAQ
ncbi:hypothetical protein ABMV06_03900 [Corynebacterium belfantii]|nr:hypothetical protein [Corynebacterium belfantii]